jgi:magnesium transporter
LISYHVHQGGETRHVDALDPAWLAPESGVLVWADVREPTPEDADVLHTVFKFHPLAIEDAVTSVHLPKIETYEQVLYVVLHGIDFQLERHSFDTLDVDFFLTKTFLVTVHDGKRRSISEVSAACDRNHAILGEGPVALMHRIVDNMVDHYRPEVEELEGWLDEIERRVLEAERPRLTSEILAVKRDISSLRRVVVPQRDIVGRLARREFDLINQEMAYRFRDVYDQLVRLADESIIFQDRVTGILDAHLASVSNRLALVSKVLAALAVIFGPLTIITGLFGMNVKLPQFPGGEDAQFWWVLLGMLAITAALYAVFKRRDWL